MKKLIIMFFMLFVGLQAAESVKSEIGIDEQLGTMIPLDLTFLNEAHESKSLKELMNGKPTMISFNYYRCSGICTPQLEDMAKMLTRLDLVENSDYKVLTISIAEDETPDLAAAKRKTMLGAIGRNFVPDAWHFLISENNSSTILADKMGFRYKKEVSPAGMVDYVHSSSLIMVSPEGKITRYLNGIEQLPFDVKMAIVEAGQGKVGPSIAKAIQNCFAYDPKAKTYVFAWEKVAATVMFAIMLIFFIYLVKTSRREDDKDSSSNKGDIR
ncbi:MAG: hypothetical protein RL113_881 [Pseudomonadota bacterium]|jgi:protein SCO1/2